MVMAKGETEYVAVMCAVGFCEDNDVGACTVGDGFYIKNEGMEFACVGVMRVMA
jgi:hypothetical protein